MQGPNAAKSEPGLASEAGDENVDGALHDPRPRPAPSGVHGGDDAPVRIDEENGQAVRRPDGEEEAGAVRDQGVPRRTARGAFSRGAGDGDVGRVDLVELDDAAAVPRREAAERREPELAGPEAVDEPGNPRSSAGTVRSIASSLRSSPRDYITPIKARSSRRLRRAGNVRRMLNSDNGIPTRDTHPYLPVR